MKDLGFQTGYLLMALNLASTRSSPNFQPLFLITVLERVKNVTLEYSFDHAHEGFIKVKLFFLMKAPIFYLRFGKSIKLLLRISTPYQLG